MLQNYKIIISYDGTDYHGWQTQPENRTIQKMLENVLIKITKKQIFIIGAGRTDAGVHAQGQTAHFKTELSIKNKDFLNAFNSLLPDDIRIVSLERVDPDFHARKMVISKIYQYRIFNSPDISPFLMRYVLHWSLPLNITNMKKGAELFIREADFTPFSSNRTIYPVRKILHSGIIKKGNEIIYTVEARGFLKYMVRTMVGTLLEIGKGKISPQKIDEIFIQKKRSLNSPTAPSKGLCLINVTY